VLLLDAVDHDPPGHAQLRRRALERLGCTVHALDLRPRTGLLARWRAGTVATRLVEVERLEHPRGWLLRVLYRLFVDLRRRYERKNVRAIDENEEFVSGEPSPPEEAERALDRWRIEDAWRHLNAEQRQLLVLHDVEGYSLAEIQVLTGLKEGTIKSRLHRARVRLGRLLQRDQTVTSLIADPRGS
jgi:RNA polymerase sigma-70 factor (ECF subfamily)